MKHLVIVGGGFGGLTVAKRLSHRKDLEITLIDQRNHHLFQPLLYQVAMAGLSPGEIATPIRSIFTGLKRVSTLLGQVNDINLVKKTVTSNFNVLTYDYLVLACGSQHSYFGNDQWAKFAPGLKSLDQATEIRKRVLLAFEKAERESDPQKQREYLTFVVVGGGPTGVELAGALGELSRYTLARDFKNIDSRNTRIFLVEGGPRILASFAPELAQKAKRNLEELGVQIWTSARVSQIDETGVQIGTERVAARTVLWAAGVEPSFLNKKLGTPLEPRGRVIVEPDCSLKAFPEVFVIGDQAYFEGKNGAALPGLAPVALQMGRHVASQITADLISRPRQPFHYFDKGQMATIGRAKAIVEIGRVRFSGLIAWLTWLFIHIYFLIGFRNKIFVFLQWAWAYVTFRKGAQLIVEPATLNTDPSIGG